MITSTPIAIRIPSVFNRSAMSGSRRIFATADCNLATIVGGTPAEDCSPRTVATSKTLVAELVATIG